MLAGDTDPDWLEAVLKSLDRLKAAVVRDPSVLGAIRVLDGNDQNVPDLIYAAPTVRAEILDGLAARLGITRDDLVVLYGAYHCRLGPRDLSI